MSDLILIVIFGDFSLNNIYSDFTAIAYYFLWIYFHVRNYNSVIFIQYFQFKKQMAKKENM